eukprot:7384430-Prymnesium_polylepis.1
MQVQLRRGGRQHVQGAGAGRRVGRCRPEGAPPALVHLVRRQGVQARHRRHDDALRRQGLRALPDQGAGWAPAKGRERQEEGVGGDNGRPTENRPGKGRRQPIRRGSGGWRGGEHRPGLLGDGLDAALALPDVVCALHREGAERRLDRERAQAGTRV